MDEGVSEMPHIFLSSLREEICMGTKEAQREKVLNISCCDILAL